VVVAKVDLPPWGWIRCCEGHASRVEQTIGVAIDGPLRGKITVYGGGCGQFSFGDICLPVFGHGADGGLGMVSVAKQRFAQFFTSRYRRKACHLAGWLL
jgi:hypothetical protein